MSDKMVEEMRASIEDCFEAHTGFSRTKDGEPMVEAYHGGHWILLDTEQLAQAAATIAERRMEEMRAERDKWKQRAFELECEHGDLKGVFVEARAALRPSGGV
jgi:hypothetical protein